MEKEDVIKYKYWNDKKYYLRGNRYFRTIPISHDVWNFHHPEDVIKQEDKHIIHHLEGNPKNDDIDNLMKMPRSEHASLHLSEKMRGSYKNRFLKFNDLIKMFSITIDGYRYTEQLQITRKNELHLYTAFGTINLGEINK